ncbi:hypothetical protein GCM10010274_10710 [Streptomyces lavendofoliae]|uniref:Uncharacterized protein n=1 Tax=Streptomyces lavendofoliae TaxID=67314 RepID=A0A918M327_9ACTN|nr:hypothetical protein GCM10010274_10710 [Streptomyces lavendofoliae]
MDEAGRAHRALLGQPQWYVLPGPGAGRTVAVKTAVPCRSEVTTLVTAPVDGPPVHCAGARSLGRVVRPSRTDTRPQAGGTPACGREVSGNDEAGRHRTEA